MLTFKTGDRFYIKTESGEIRKFTRGADKRWTWRKGKATASDSDIRVSMKYRTAFLAHVNDNIIEGHFNG